MKPITAKDVDLPDAKRRELAFVVETLRDGFAAATAKKSHAKYREAKILKIILFGSYARGDWVEDPVGRYFSDYDILVVVDREEATDGAEFWAKTEARLLEEVGEGMRLRTLVSPIYHSLDEVNAQLRLGRYFFIDILRDGIVLFEEPGHRFETPQPLSPKQALKETQDYYEEWFESAQRFLQYANDGITRGWPKEAAFQLHQATERFYHCLFLVRTLYSPKTHNLNRLRSQTEQLEPRLASVWPAETKFERRCYELLRAAYVKARYSRQYVITPEQLAWLSERVSILQDLIRELCIERIEDLAKAA
jgi:uncharacterized protein